MNVVEVSIRDLRSLFRCTACQTLLLASLSYEIAAYMQGCNQAGHSCQVLQPQPDVQAAGARAPKHAGSNQS